MNGSGRESGWLDAFANRLLSAAVELEVRRPIDRTLAALGCFTAGAVGFRVLPQPADKVAMWAGTVLGVIALIQLVFPLGRKS